MRQKITPHRVLLFAGILVLLLFGLFQVSQQSNVVIRFHDDQIEVQKLSNALAQIIVEEGYGYKTELVESTIKEVHGRLTRGDIDVTMELWKGNNLLWYEHGVKTGKLLDLGVLYTGRQYWIVSAWYAAEKNIHTVSDMKSHWQDFVEPGDPSKGIFFNCIVGWTCRDINTVKLEAYGLDPYYNTVSPLSPESLESIYRNAQLRKIPVFGYYWEPNLIMSGENWRILKEPAFSDPVWDKVLAAAFRAGEDALDEACAYPQSGVYKVASAGLERKAPDVVRMLRAMRIEIAQYYDLLAQDGRLVGRNYPALAQIYLRRHPEQWSGWVTRSARDNLLEYLEQNSPDSEAKR